MIRECGEMYWFIEQDGTVSFYLRGKQEAMTKEQFMKWLKRKFSAR